jgi:hypothetical protein
MDLRPAFYSHAMTSSAPPKINVRKLAAWSRCIPMNAEMRHRESVMQMEICQDVVAQKPEI